MVEKTAKKTDMSDSVNVNVYISVLGLQEKFKTLEAAYAEIVRLEIENARLRYKRPPHRPKKPKNIVWQGGFFGTLLAEAQPKNRGGRPPDCSPDEMREVIGQIEELKKLALEGSKIKFINDRKIITIIVGIRPDTRSLRSDKKKKFIKKMYNQLKYYRQKTGLPQGQRTPRRST